MKEEPPAKPRRLRLGKLRWWVLVLILAGGCYQWWRINDYENAVWEAKLAGFSYYSVDPITVIRADWRNALHKETWSANQRLLDLEKIPDLARYRDLIHRLRPTHLHAFHIGDESLEVLKGLTSLQSLILYSCTAVQNVDALKGLTSLQEVHLGRCNALQNVDGLKGLTGLQALSLSDSPALQNVDGLKGLTRLQHLILEDCPALKNVDALKSLTALKTLCFSALIPGLNAPDPVKSTRIPEATLRELRAALPNTTIQSPDGSISHPQ